MIRTQIPLLFSNVLFYFPLIFLKLPFWHCLDWRCIFRRCHSSFFFDPSANRTVFNPPCKTLLSLLHQRCPSKRHYAWSQINKIQKWHWSLQSGHWIHERTYSFSCHYWTDLQGQPGRQITTAEDIQKSMWTWHHRLFFEAEDQHCKRTDPIQTYEFYTDFRLSWIYLHSLLLKTIQKRNWNDTVWICIFNQGNVRREVWGKLVENKTEHY